MVDVGKYVPYMHAMGYTDCLIDIFVVVYHNPYILE